MAYTTLTADILAAATAGIPLTPTAATRPAGERALSTDLPTTDPDVFADVFTSWEGDRKIFRTTVWGVRIAEGGKVRTMSLLDGLTIHITDRAARYSAKGLRDAHHAAGAQLGLLLAKDPAHLDIPLARTPRD